MRFCPRFGIFYSRIVGHSSSWFLTQAGTQGMVLGTHLCRNKKNLVNRIFDCRGDMFPRRCERNNSRMSKESSDMATMQTKLKEQRMVGLRLAGAGERSAVHGHANRCRDGESGGPDDAHGDGEGGRPRVGLCGESHPQFSAAVFWLVHQIVCPRV